MTRKHRRPGGWRVRLVAQLMMSSLMVAVLALPGCLRRPAHRTFATPEEGVRVLIDTVKGGKLEELVAIFGPESQSLVSSSDRETGTRNREVFMVAVDEQWRLVGLGPDRRELVVGNEDWPFPVPLVNEGGAWRFDTAAGAEEVVARRIGRNELATIRVCQTYVAAQRRYASRGHDGKPAGLFARRFRSEPGTENGLFWPAKRGQPRSPIGELIADASFSRRSDEGTEPAPFHGYYFRILEGQGTVGDADYVVKGEMSGGFALVAWPAQYDATGVMTFIVNHDGLVYEQDLGRDTSAKAAAITRYDPGTSWHRAQAAVE